MFKVIAFLVVVPLLFAMTAKDPLLMAHVLRSVVTSGLRALDATASALNSFLAQTGK